MAGTEYLPERKRSGPSGAAMRGAYHRRVVLTDSIVADFASDWRQHGAKALERLRETNVGTYCKLMVMLVPRDIHVEHHNPVGELSNEQLDSMIAHITERLEAKANEAKVINGQAVEIESLPAPAEDPEAELLAPRPKPKRERRKRVKKRKLRPRVRD